MILVIDRGTTNTKAFLFDLKGKPVCGARCSTKTTHPGSGMVEQEAEDWWCSAVNAVKRCMKHGAPGRGISAIVTSTQGGTFVSLGNDLKPLQPGITWLDNRAINEAAKLNRCYGKNFFYYKNGRSLQGWNSLALILWLKGNKRNTYRKMRRMSFVADYLNYKMTGRQTRRLPPFLRYFLGPFGLHKKAYI